MDWKRYKTLCDRPDIWSRWFVERLLELVAEAERDELRKVMDTAPLARPADHRGGSATQMFEVQLPTAAVEAMVHKLRSLKAAGTVSGALAQRGLGGFTEALEEYLQLRCADAALLPLRPDDFAVGS